MNAWAHPTHRAKRHPDPISRFATIHIAVTQSSDRDYFERVR